MLRRVEDLIEVLGFLVFGFVFVQIADSAQQEILCQ